MRVANSISWAGRKRWAVASAVRARARHLSSLSPAPAMSALALEVKALWTFVSLLTKVLVSPKA